MKVSEKELEFFVEVLSREDRKKIAALFADDLSAIMSRPAVFKLLKGRTHLSNENIIKLMRNNKQAREYIAALLKERALKIMEIADAILEDAEIEWPLEAEKEDEEKMEAEEQ